MHILFYRYVKCGERKEYPLERCQRETVGRLRAVFTGKRGKCIREQICRRSRSGERRQIRERALSALREGLTALK